VAVQIATEVGYSNAGTVEFLLGDQKDFYFLEMNTRLQVEHCVTEMVTGVDIVKEQLRIAGGRRLRLRQEDVRVRGWAIECRVMAEDPYNDFLPSIGRITGLYEPTGPGVRVDSGVHEGFQVSPYYDSLIAKLVAWGETRAEAILRMRRALEEYRVIGVKTTIPFYLELMNSARFISGRFDTTSAEASYVLAEEKLEEHLKLAAIAATLVAHNSGVQIRPVAVPPDQQQMSKWKMFGRWQTLGKDRM
jgi:acetyl/propionyl-CoA carboxylase alpha subunit